MRRVGSFADSESAERFAGFLRKQGLECRVDSQGGQAGLWLFDEDAIERVRVEFERFRTGALQIPVEKKPALQSPVPPQRKSRVRRPRKWQFNHRLLRSPVTSVLMLASVVATIVIDFGNNFVPYGNDLAIVPFQDVNLIFGYPDLWQRLSRGEVWRLITPILLHFHILHLLLNLQWTYVFGTAIEHVRGSLKFLGLVLFSAVASNVGQYLWSGPAFGGLSGIGYAMFGYVWMKYRFQPEVGLVLPASLFWLFWLFYFLCFTDFLGVPVANMAHTVGLVAGILYGLFPRL